MLDALHPGDRLVVVPWASVRPGDVVAARDPRQPARILVKRVAGSADGALDLIGDNTPASTDSRHFGPVPRSLLVGRAVYRYWPPERSGWLPRRAP
jgi:nickel-type superoxide dismutase maturation protease